MMSNQIEVLTPEQSEHMDRLKAIGYKPLPAGYEDWQCRKCWKAGGLVFKDYDDEGCHEDTDYHCVICKKGWIAEGSDY